MAKMLRKRVAVYLEWSNRFDVNTFSPYKIPITRAGHEESFWRWWYIRHEQSNLRREELGIAYPFILRTIASPLGSKLSDEELIAMDMLQDGEFDLIATIPGLYVAEGDE